MTEPPSTVCGRIAANRAVADGYFVMSLRVAPSFGTPLPGQFIMLKAKAAGAQLLGRPLSVYDFERRDTEAVLHLLYKVVGTGTGLFSGLHTGDDLEILGPLGKHFALPAGMERLVLVAGGVGIAPLTFLASWCRAQGAKPRITCYVGAANAGALAGLDRMESLGVDLRISTDDGSRGYHGLVTELLEGDVASLDARRSAICACGPSAMLRRMARILEGHPVPCFVSLEERMACGLGACLGCAVPVKTAGPGCRYKRVCKDGPVFDIRELAWDG